MSTNVHSIPQESTMQNNDAKSVSANLKSLFLNMLEGTWKEERITKAEYDTAVNSFTAQFDNIPDTRDQVRFVARWSNTLSTLIGLGRR